MLLGSPSSGGGSCLSVYFFYKNFVIIEKKCISNYRTNSTSDSYDSIIRWLIPEAFYEIPNRGRPLVIELLTSITLPTSFSI